MTNVAGQRMEPTVEAAFSLIDIRGLFADRHTRCGERVYRAALGFLAAQRQVDRAQLAVFGHSEGGIYALLLASGLAGPAPRVRAIGLLEPVPIRMLDLLQHGPMPPPPVTGAAQQGQMRELVCAEHPLRIKLNGPAAAS
jgi:pimeloyl-ACP methyl ester carboxylesterase